MVCPYYFNSVKHYQLNVKKERCSSVKILKILVAGKAGLPFFENNFTNFRTPSAVRAKRSVTVLLYFESNLLFSGVTRTVGVDTTAAVVEVAVTLPNQPAIRLLGKLVVGLSVCCIFLGRLGHQLGGWWVPALVMMTLVS